MKIRLYTQFGTDEKRRQYAYCSAYAAAGDDDGEHLGDARRVLVMELGSLDEACKTARRLGLRMLERYTLDLRQAVTVELVAAMDQEG